MELYIQEGLEEFNLEVEQKIGKLIDDIEPYMTDIIRETIYINIRQSTEMFLNSPEITATKLDEQINKFRSRYADTPDLLNPALESIKSQFQSLLSANRANLDNYIAGMKRELIK